jgi:hypothetical protein
LPKFGPSSEEDIQIHKQIIELQTKIADTKKFFITCLNIQEKKTFNPALEFSKEIAVCKKQIHSSPKELFQYLQHTKYIVDQFITSPETTQDSYLSKLYILAQNKGVQLSYLYQNIYVGNQYYIHATAHVHILFSVLEIEEMLQKIRTILFSLFEKKESCLIKEVIPFFQLFEYDKDLQISYTEDELIPTIRKVISFFILTHETEYKTYISFIEKLYHVLTYPTHACILYQIKKIFALNISYTTSIKEIYTNIQNYQK